MDDSTSNLPEETDGSRSKWIAVIAGLAIAGVVVAILFAVGAFDGDDDEVASTTTVPETSAPVTTIPGTTVPDTTTPATTTPDTTTPNTTTPDTTAPQTTPPDTTTPDTTSPPNDLLQLAIFPTPGMGTTFSDPVEVAREFALAVGFADPLAGEFRQGDGRSGEVEVRAIETMPPSVVFVRQLDEQENWYVIGAATANIVVDSPDPLEEVSSPLEVAGQARAFEGTVQVLLTADDVSEPLVDDFVTGSGGEDLGPFEGSFEFEAPDVDGGTVLFLSRSSEDDSVLEMGAVRVVLADE